MKEHGLVYHSALGSRVIKKKKYLHILSDVLNPTTADRQVCGGGQGSDAC